MAATTIASKLIFIPCNSKVCFLFLIILKYLNDIILLFYFIFFSQINAVSNEKWKYDTKEISSVVSRQQGIQNHV